MFQLLCLGGRATDETKIMTCGAVSGRRGPKVGGLVRWVSGDSDGGKVSW